MKKDGYAIHGDHWYSEIVESEYLVDENALRIKYVSDVPPTSNVVAFINERHPSLSVKIIERMYYDRDWLYNERGTPFALIIVFFK